MLPFLVVEVFLSIRGHLERTFFEFLQIVGRLHLSKCIHDGLFLVGSFLSDFEQICFWRVFRFVLYQELVAVVVEHQSVRLESVLQLFLGADLDTKQVVDLLMFFFI